MHSLGVTFGAMLLLLVSTVGVFYAVHKVAHKVFGFGPSLVLAATFTIPTAILIGLRSEQILSYLRTWLPFAWLE